MGSSPIARSRFSNLATWPSGKARVCKTLIMGSNPIVASKLSEHCARFFSTIMDFTAFNNSHRRLQTQRALCSLFFLRSWISLRSTIPIVASKLSEHCARFFFYDHGFHCVQQFPSLPPNSASIVLAFSFLRSYFSLRSTIPIVASKLSEHCARFFFSTIMDFAALNNSHRRLKIQRALCSLFLVHNHAQQSALGFSVFPHMIKRIPLFLKIKLLCCKLENCFGYYSSVLLTFAKLM